MELISNLSDKIEEELEDACSYIDMAIDAKSTDPVTANLYAQLSEEEMGHMEKLHARVVAVIDAYRKEKGDPPADMLRLYDILHKKHIEKASRIKAKQMLYKEGTK